MNIPMNRRMFLRRSALAAGLAGALISPLGNLLAANKKPLFKISLAEWSLHRTINSGKLTHLDFPRTAKEEFGIEAIEHVNQFFKDKANDKTYLKELKKRTKDLGVRNVLIMCDGEGALGDADEAKRQQAVENHYKWVEAAKYLGCHSIRVNAQSSGSYEEQMERAADGLRKLGEFGAKHKINVIVENHGGLSSNGAWLSAVIQKTGLPNCGTLPDFGNFNLGNGQTYDRYKGMEELMRFAKGTSAKSNDFDEEGNEIHTDFLRVLKIITAAGYHGYVGIEYEGEKLSEADGIRATKKLLEKVRNQLAG